MGKFVFLVRQAMRALPKRNVELVDILEDDPCARMLWEFSPAEVRRHVAMMSEINLARIAKAEKGGPPFVGPFVRRMRGEKSGSREQRVEVRSDGLANALRTIKGGSSKQFIVIAAGTTRMRALQPREAARLMGLPDSYVLPSDPIEALSLCGDGVAVPVVRFLVERIIEPALADPAQDAQGSPRTAVSAAGGRRLPGRWRAGYRRFHVFFPLPRAPLRRPPRPAAADPGGGRALPAGDSGPRL
jgi:hypothetical protein